MAVPDRTRTRLFTYRWVVVVALLAIASNVALSMVTAGGGKGSVFSIVPDGFEEEVLTAMSLGGDRVAFVTLDSEVIVTRDDEELARTQFGVTLNDAVYLPDRGELILGANDGLVYAYDTELNLRRKTDLESGLVQLLAAMPDGSVVVGTGTGAHGDLFYITTLDPRSQAGPAYQVGRPMWSVAGLDSLALAGDERAWVTAVAPDGTLQWETQLERDVTVLCGLPTENRVLAGDKAGNAYLLDGASGEVLWQTNLTQWPMKATQPAGKGLVAFGDKEGSLYLLDQEGTLLLSQPFTGDSVAAILPLDQGRLLAVRRSGQMTGIDTRALSAAQLTQSLRPIRLALNGVWVVLLLCALARAVERVGRAVAYARGQLSRSSRGYMFLVPSLLCILIFNYLPNLMAVYYSMTDYRPGTPMRFVGLDNFARVLLRDRYFWKGMGNMLLIMATRTAKVLSMPLLVALLVFHLRSAKARYGFRIAVLVPSVVPAIVGTLMWKMMYAPGDMGFVNNLLALLGRPELQRSWLGNEATAIWAVIFSGFPWVGAFGFLIYLGGLININPEMFDAGAIDGVNAWQRLWHIEWPLLSPQRSLLLFFTYLGAIQGYAGIYVFTQGGPGHATYVPALQMFLRLSRGMEVGYASSIGLVLLVMVLAVTVIRRRFEAREAHI